MSLKSEHKHTFEMTFWNYNFLFFNLEILKRNESYVTSSAELLGFFFFIIDSDFD